MEAAASTSATHVQKERKEHPSELVESLLLVHGTKLSTLARILKSGQLSAYGRNWETGLALAARDKRPAVSATMPFEWDCGKTNIEYRMDYNYFRWYTGIFNLISNENPGSDTYSVNLVYRLPLAFFQKQMKDYHLTSPICAATEYQDCQGSDLINFVMVPGAVPNIYLEQIIFGSKETSVAFAEACPNLTQQFKSMIVSEVTLEQRRGISTASAMQFVRDMEPRFFRRVTNLPLDEALEKYPNLKSASDIRFMYTRTQYLLITEQYIKLLSNLSIDWVAILQHLIDKPDNDPNAFRANCFMQVVRRLMKNVLSVTVFDKMEQVLRAKVESLEK